MDRLLGLGLSAAMLVVTVLRGGGVLAPLVMTLIGFCGLYWQRGIALADLLTIMGRGAKQAFGVLGILLLIGGLMAAWMAAGTVAILIYYGLQLIQPEWFLLSAFALTALVSSLIGTSFGAVGTIGLALMIMARSGAGNLPWTAGAIVAGAYVGDRCSPLSSSAYLVATLTRTNLYNNLRVMATSSLTPLLLSSGIYLLASRQYPLVAGDRAFWGALPDAFNLHWLTLLPAIMVFLLVLGRVPVKVTLLLSLALATAIALGIQGYSPRQMAAFLVFGFHLEAPQTLIPIFHGGGLWPMAKVCLIVLVSTSLARLLTETQTLGLLQQWLETLNQGRRLFASTLLISLVAAAYGCTQTMAIVLTCQLTQANYQQAHLTNRQQAIDLENTAVVMSPLIPWNIAGLVPATLLMVNAEFIPCAVYLYVLPLWELLRRPSRLLS